MPYVSTRPGACEANAANQRIIGIQHSNRVAPVQTFNQLALGQRNFLDRRKKFQVRRGNARNHANVRLGDRGKLLQLVPPRHAHLQHRGVVFFLQPKQRERQARTRC